MMVLETLFPLFALLALGVGLKKTGMTSDSFLKTSDRLVYYIFFPLMLFWKIGNSASIGQDAAGLCFAGFTAMALAFGAGLFWAVKSGMPARQVGAFSQACYRFNTYIGMVIILNTLGEEGVRYFGILAGFVIPFANVLAVSVLIWFSNKGFNTREKVRHFLFALIANPLILGCAAGILFSRSGWVIPGFLNNTFSLMTSVTLPLALISIGGSLRFAGLSRYVAPSLVAAFIKILLLPVAGFLAMKLFQVSGVAFKTGMLFFCLPTSTAIYVLSAQLDADTEMAAEAIMVSTALSFLSLSVALII